MSVATAAAARPPWWRGITLDQARAPGDDNALPLRHLASLMVIYGHSYDLTQRSGDIVAASMPGFKAGMLAVYLFFAISGYLVMLSALRHPGVWRYFRNRALRILPGYWLSLAVCVLVLGPVFTTLAAGDYLRHPGTWSYVASNFVPLTFVWHLPGVFAGNPLPDTVNGSLWSLGLELRWYGYLGVLLALGVASRRWAFTLVGGAFLVFAGYEWWIGKPDPYQFRALSAVFVAAALMAHWRAHIALSHPLMAAWLLACALAHGGPWFGAVAVATAVYATFWIVYALPAWHWPVTRDYSYGLFLYGFPSQQALLATWPELAPMLLFGAASALALAFSVLSWHLVEAPALRLKRGRGQDRDAPAASEPARSDASA